MSQLNKRIITYLLLVLLCGCIFSGCKKQDDDASADDGKVSEEAADEALDNTTAQVANENPADNNQANDPTQNQQNPEAVIPTDNAPKQAITERSPVEITRIEMQDPIATGSGDVINNNDDHNHEPAPNLFPIAPCQVEVQGIYQVKLAKDLLKEINSRRKDYGIGQLKQNTSLLACADSRCKEQTYFIGHFRPDGSAFTSVAPDYVQGECIAVEYRTVKEIMEAWFAVNGSRYQIMNPDYTQCGISIYDIEGTYYIAAEFSY